MNYEKIYYDLMNKRKVNKLTKTVSIVKDIILFLNHQEDQILQIIL